MYTDTAQMGHSIVELVNYCWEDELRDFAAIYDMVYSSQDDLEPWIQWCENAARDWKEGNGIPPTNHAFYHLMVIKASFILLFDKWDEYCREMNEPDWDNVAKRQEEQQWYADNSNT